MRLDSVFKCLTIASDRRGTFGRFARSAVRVGEDEDRKKGDRRNDKPDYRTAYKNNGIK